MLRGLTTPVRIGKYGHIVFYYQSDDREVDRFEPGELVYFLDHKKPRLYRVVDWNEGTGARLEKTDQFKQQIAVA